MLLWKKKKPGNDRAMDGLKHNRVAGQGIVVQTAQLEANPQGTDFFIPTPIYGCDRSSLQEECSHA